MVSRLALRRLVLSVHAIATTAVRASPAIRRVVVSGGTHGNEYTGVYVIERLATMADQLRAEYPSLEVETLLANPVAHASNCRFVDADLNRMFTPESLHDLTLPGYEPNRAKAIAALLGGDAATPAADFCIDLHTTTSDMGCTMIVDEWCPLACRIAAYIEQQWQAACDADAAAGGKEGSAAAARRHELRILLHTGMTREETPYLCSVAKHGLQIEVGPTPQGLIRADVMQTTERALKLVLQYLERHNRGEAPPPPPTMRVYVDRGKIAWEDGHHGSKLPGSIVHPNLQDRDFLPLHKGEPLFLRRDGTVELYDGSMGEVVYPIFINEAAYYYAQSGTGVGLTECLEWPVPSD